MDAETYPVADSLSLAWYTGLGREAAQERWGFAFSAKDKWRSKFRSDVEKIAATNRGYAKAFFVTNQFVRDRTRSDLEDELSSELGLDVRIFDRTWILDRVFGRNHQELAVSELGLTALTRRSEEKGPLDAKREEALATVENKINERLREYRVGPGLVDLALEAADLARSLERPRAEIEGRYKRADELSLKFGTDRQQVESAYQWAFIFHFWFEDFPGLIVQYAVVEERTRGSQNARDLEQLTTLWFALHTAVKGESADASDASYGDRTATLIAELQRMSGEKDRPSTALSAKTLFLQVQLSTRLADGQSVDNTLRSLKDVVLS